MDDWKKAKNLALSDETFLAWTQTLSASANFSQYIVEKHQFKCVFMGEFQSDPPEDCFGVHRQPNGASYFICVRQVVFAKKRLAS